MTHFEVRCPECVGGMNLVDCPFGCTRNPKPMIEKVKSLVFYFRCTCVDCGARWDCGFAYDGYNTEGDCLAEK